ncbi:MAG: hypothetical protein HY020_07070 [Burkholderiales bacterium]|nr:hypothetical protein [Burkholderiales bacterium]
MTEFGAAGYPDLVELDKRLGDPLGFAAGTERLYNTIFPGYNNVVRHLRVYSSLCWMARTVGDSLKSDPPASEAEARGRQSRALEKMQIIFLWANEGQVSGLQVAGASRGFPVTNEPVPLLFENWESSANLLANVAYGPSITNGLGFLNRERLCTTAGEALAAAFEKNLPTDAQLAWLRDVNVLEARRSQIKRIQGALNLHTPRKAEKEAFLAAFFPGKQASLSGARAKNRWSGIHLTLASIAASPSGRATETEIRGTMARGISPLGTQVVKPGLEEMQSIWAILQLQQLQRLATETLFGAVLLWIEGNQLTGAGIDECVNAMRESGEKQYQKHGISLSVDLETYLRAYQGSKASFYDAASHNPGTPADVLEHLRVVGSHNSLQWIEGGCRAVAEAVTALTFVTMETLNLTRSSKHRELLNELSAERGSLLSMARSQQRLRAEPVGNWIAHLVIDWTFARYFEVVTARSEGSNGKLRFAFTTGENGLEMCGPHAEPFQPNVSTDKLRHTLLLCIQCGLVNSVGSGDQTTYFLTAAGRSRVDSYEADREVVQTA